MAKVIGLKYLWGLYIGLKSISLCFFEISQAAKPKNLLILVRLLDIESYIYPNALDNNGIIKIHDNNIPKGRADIILQNAS